MGFPTVTSCCIYKRHHTHTHNFLTTNELKEIKLHNCWRLKNKISPNNASVQIELTSKIFLPNETKLLHKSARFSIKSPLQHNTV